MNPFSPEYSRFPRDSRHVYGHRFQVEKRDRDWMWGVAGLAAFCLAIVIMAGQL
jgi:hypothetical protein